MKISKRGKELVKELCKQLKGWYLTIEENEVFFDFEINDTILTISYTDEKGLYICEDITENDYLISMKEYFSTDKFTCPYCDSTGEYSDFPDLVYPDSEDKPVNEQSKVLNKLQKQGFNVVTCRDCGAVILVDKEEI